MIQRVQSIYLLLSFLILGSLFFTPSIRLVTESEEVWQLMPGGFKSSISGSFAEISSLPYLFFLAIVVLLPVINVFLFRSRQAQIRISIFTILMNVGFLAFGYYFAFQGAKVLSIKMDIFGSSLFYFAIISAILNYLAFKGIQKDEKLVKSYDRIR